MPIAGVTFDDVMDALRALDRQAREQYRAPPRYRRVLGAFGASIDPGLNDRAELFLAFWSSSNEAWATASLWLIGAGVVTAALAALAGLTDVIGEPRIRRLNEEMVYHHRVAVHDEPRPASLAQPDVQSHRAA
jgi:hypothetical protein